MAERQQDQEFDNHGDLILTGSANAYVAAPARAISGYFQGLRICGKANFTNSGASTLEIISPHSPVGLGAIAIRKGVTTALTGGEIISGKYYDFLYDATNSVFQLPNVAPNSSITNAQLADMAQLTIKARKTLSTGAPEDCTLSEVLDFITSAAQGDILYRGASAWSRLAAGTSGFFLKTQGTGADPIWAAASSVVPVTQGSVSAVATLDLSLSTADMYEIDLINFAPATDAVTFQARFSQSGSFLSGATDYDYGFVDGNDAPETSTGATQINITSGQGNNTNENLTVTLRIFRPSASSFRKTLLWNGSQSRTDSSTFPNHGRGRLMNNTNAVDGIRFLFSSGNISSGFYAMRSYNFT